MNTHIDNLLQDIRAMEYHLSLHPPTSGIYHHLQREIRLAQKQIEKLKKEGEFK